MYKVIDDRGVWVAAATAGEGPFASMEQAQVNAAVRNISDGTADEDGTFKADFTKENYKTWRKNHLARKDCTCKSAGGATK